MCKVDIFRCPVCQCYNSKEDWEADGNQCPDCGFNPQLKAGNRIEGAGDLKHSSLQAA